MARMILIAVVALILPACSPAGQRSTGAGIPADYEIEDVRNLPQEMGAYASFCPAEPIGKACRDSLEEEFRRKHYSPWGGSAPLSDLARAAGIMTEHARKEWYGENNRKVSGTDLAALLANCDLEHFPSMGRAAIAIVPTAMRVLPTARPLFARAGDFPFDALQNADRAQDERTVKGPPPFRRRPVGVRGNRRHQRLG
ncbi:MAG: hypothetical protein NDI77_11900 [Geobacteraceae bacterium]|nr:hypothetical protein [Geobacteraceae bacterium]